MKARDIIVIGASAGGLVALRRLMSQLPPILPATVFIVQHLASAFRSNLAILLERAGKLKVSQAVDGERFVQGHVYVAPPTII
jgi:two-component system, chemotaxis family, protein-glutamate methylesterase/glutaminase